MKGKKDVPDTPIPVLPRRAVAVCPCCWRRTSQESAEEIDQLIRELGSDESSKQEAAARALKDMGEPALEPIRKAADTSSDRRVRPRAKML
jgi:hypothetical protein